MDAERPAAPRPDAAAGRPDAAVDAAEVLRASLDPADGPVERLDTHISTLIFQGGWAFKIKRPVHFEFVDLSTPERREEDCRREVEQNRRFTHDVYEGVVEIRDDTGRVIDHAVKMRRMPSHRRLSTLLASADVADRVLAFAAIRGVARQMAVAHALAPRRRGVDAVATPDAIARLWQRSTDDLRELGASIIDPARLVVIQRQAEDYLGGRRALFAERIARGFVVDGHGDLLADDIFCLDDGPRILDCLEFDDDLRFGDVLLDIGFLAMDLERLGHGDAAALLVETYAEYSDEHHPMSLLHHYVAYRALVRSKIAAIRAQSSSGSDGVVADAAVAEARSLLALCERHLRLAQPTLVLVGGLPASGKSTIASALAARRGWLLLEADRVRKELAGVGANPAPSSFNTGIYSPTWTLTTYATLLDRATIALHHGESVVLDASFVDRRWRVDAASVAALARARHVAIHCVAADALRQARLASRPHDAEHLSDAGGAVAAAMAAVEDPWGDEVVVDTSADVELCLDRVLRAVGGDVG